MTTVIEDSFNVRCSVDEEKDYGYGDAIPSVSVTSQDNDDAGFGYGQSKESENQYGYNNEEEHVRPPQKRERPRRRGSVTKFTIEAQDTVKQEYDAHSNVISGFRGGADVAPPAAVGNDPSPTAVNAATAPKKEVSVDTSGISKAKKKGSHIEGLVPLNDTGTRRSSSTGASKYITKKSKKDGGSSSHSRSSTASSICNSMEINNSSRHSISSSKYDYDEQPVVASGGGSSNTDFSKYGYGDPDNKYGYGDATPAPESADKYGYGVDTNTAEDANTYGYGDTSADTNKYGYGDPSNATESTESTEKYGYGDTTEQQQQQQQPPSRSVPTRENSVDSSSAPGARRPRRRGSVTKFSIESVESQTSVQVEFKNHENMINQFRNGMTDNVNNNDSLLTGEEISMPLKNSRHTTSNRSALSARSGGDLSEDEALSGDEMSCDTLSDDDLESSEHAKVKKKKKKIRARIGRRLGRTLSTISMKSKSSHG